MRAMRFLALATAVGIGGWAHAAHAQHPAAGRERLTGAWHLVSLGETNPKGRLETVAGLKGALIYTRDGHMSVQIQYPDASVSNAYVLHGYEASFGTYDVDPAAHTVTHHVEGSITRGLVGKTLVRAYRLSGRRLIIRSTRPEEHWQVTWERDEAHANGTN